MSTEITINQDIVEINVTEEVVVIEAPSGAYPLPSMVSSVFGRTGNVVAQEGDYTLTQLGDVTISTPSNGQVLRYNGTTWVNATESFAGTVTSVNMSVPTGLTISGNPITTSGTLAVGLGAGYVIPTQAALDAKQDDLNGTGIVKSTAGTITYLSDNTANWNTAYNDSIVSASVTGTATKTLTLNQQDGGSVTASWTDTDTGLTSVGLSMPSAFSVANSPLTANGTLSVTGAGTTAQYVRGDGSLATFPTIAQEAQRLITEVYNSTGATLTKGTVVYINGGQGNLPTVTKAIATGDATSAQTYGVVQSDITNMNNGFVVAMGSLTDLDTQIYPVGTQLYLSGTTAGAWTSTKPYAPIHLVYVGIVVRSHPTQGVVEIRIQNGYELDELHDVSAQSPTNGDILQYVAATDLWTKTAGTTTNIAEGTNLYFTDARARAAISLTTTGTSGASTYNNTTGVLNIPQYQGVLTNPVTGTGTTNTLPKFTGTSTIGNSNITDTGSLITLNSNSYINGALGIGTTSITSGNVNLFLARNLTGDVNVFSVNTESVIQSDVTTHARYFRTAASTAAASFTLSELSHYEARQGTFGAGSAVGTQQGFVAGSSLVGATNNFGFRGRIPAAINRWNLFMDGTAANYLAGALLVGTTADAGFLFRVNNGTSRFNGAAFALPASSGTTQTGLIQRIGNSNSLVNIDMGGNDSGGMWLQVANSGNLAATYPLMLNPNSGQVLINTSTSSSFALDVNGTARISGQLTANSFVPTSSTIPTNGMYLSGTNTLGFATNGTLDMVLDANGALGIGSTSLTGINLRLGKTITGATTAYGILQQGIVQSDVTTTAFGYYNEIGTQAAAFTLTNYRHFFATASTIGAGSAVTNQVGFFASATLTGGTNNYGFQGSIPSGTNRWNLFMDGTANNYLAGSLAIGTTSFTSGGGTYNLNLAKNITGSVVGGAMNIGGLIQSDVTSAAIGLNVQVTTAAAAFTLNQLRHISVNQTTLGVGSSVSNQYGIYVDQITNGTSNFGFFGNIPSGTNRWNLYMNGTANNYMAGALTIGSAILGTNSLQINRGTTGGATANTFSIITTAASDVTNRLSVVSTSIGTQAAAFTLGTLEHFRAQQGTFGAGSAVTTQAGFRANTNLVGATSNIGFWGSIPSAANNWNLYMDGNANNYMAGSLGIGGTSLTNSNLLFNKTISGAVTSYGIFGTSIVGADVTTSARYYATSVSTAASAFTLADLVHFYCGQGSFGAGSTVTNQYGFFVQSSLQSATNNYGFYGNIPSGTNRWNLYMAGTAANYMAGNLRIGTTTTDGTSLLEVAGNVNFNGSGSRTVSITRDSGSTLQLQSSVTATGSFIFTSTNGPLNLGANNTNNFVTITTSGQLGVNSTSPNASARLQVDSTTQGFLPPRMTTTQKNAIGTPAAGLMVYDTTLNQMSYYNGTTWINF